MQIKEKEDQLRKQRKRLRAWAEKLSSSALRKEGSDEKRRIADHR